MKITKRQLRQIIKEEVSRLNETMPQRGMPAQEDARGVLRIAYTGAGTTYFVGGERVDQIGNYNLIVDSWDEMTGDFKSDHFRDDVVPSFGITHVMDQHFFEQGRDELNYPIPVEEYIRLR